MSATPAMTLLAFDWSPSRVGVAVGNGLRRQGEPLKTLALRGDAVLEAIAALVREWQASALVVGVPRHPDGAAHLNTARAAGFARRLRARFNLPVHEVDERYTTVEARALGAVDADATAAALILDQYFAQTASEDLA